MGKGRLNSIYSSANFILPITATLGALNLVDIIVH
jgi:hypothetical protein